MKTFAKIKSGAFTLIELLAAMTITTVLVLVIVALTSRGVDIWRWVLQDVRTTTLARTAMDTMTKDFESMQFRSGNPFEWMLVQRDSDLVSRAGKTKVSRKKGRSSSLNEARVNLMTMGPEGAKITNASQLVFFTTATDRNPAKSSMDMRNDRIIGDVNCVGYKLLYRDQILDQDATAESDGFPVYSLYRNLISAEDTVRNLLGQQDLAACPLLHAQKDLAVAAQPGFIQQIAGGGQCSQCSLRKVCQPRKGRAGVGQPHQSTRAGAWPKPHRFFPECFEDLRETV